MLMRREIRSWLYQVDKGATTIWERWDAIQEDGTINPGDIATDTGDQEPSMISFNHYAYGAVVDWIYRNVAGLSPVQAEPGYRRTIVAPLPARGFSFAGAAIESPFGKLAIDWQLTSNETLVAHLSVPFGVKAELRLPTTADSQVFVNGQRDQVSELDYGEYLIRVTRARILDYKG